MQVFPKICFCLALLLLLPLVAHPAYAPINCLIDFQQYRFGIPPSEFTFDATGPHGPVQPAGRPLWRTYIDQSAPSPKFVLIGAAGLPQSNHFPIALVKGLDSADIKLAASFKLLSGKVERSAGLLWHWLDKNNYEAVMVSGLNENLRLLRFTNGQQILIKQANLSLSPNAWHFLEVSAQGDNIRIWLDDKPALEVEENSLTPSGQVGLITGADSIVLFDDLYIQSGPGRIQRKATVSK